MNGLRRRLRHRLARWLLHGVRDLDIGSARVRELHMGDASVSWGNPGPADVARWSGTATPTAAGDLGMNVATGRPLAFVGGGSSALALLSEVGAVSNSGSTTRTAASGSGAVVVPHALGRTPKAIFALSTQDGAPTAIGSSGWARDTAANICTWFNTVVFNNVDSANILHPVGSTGNGFTGVISALDGTNFTLTYTIAGAGANITTIWMALA